MERWERPGEINCVERHSRLVIDAQAMRENWSVVRAQTAGEVIAVVKENGYGLGLRNVYDILAGTDVRYFGVTGAREALALRSYGWTGEILMMTPPLTWEEAEPLVRANVILALESVEQADLLEEIGRSLGVRPRVHVKIDTGMGRYGFYYDHIPRLSGYARTLRFEGAFSHLAGKPRGYEQQVSLQAQRFDVAIEALRAQDLDVRFTHLCNSRGTMTFGDMGFAGVRAGTALLGKTQPRKGLREAVWLESEIYDVTERPKGWPVSYQSREVLSRDSRLGIVRAGHGDGIGIGYVDGHDTLVHGVLSAAKHGVRPSLDRMTVSVRGKRLPVLGKCGVAHTIVDLTDSDAEAGDTVRFSVNPLLVSPYVEKTVFTESPERETARRPRSGKR